MVCVVVEVVGLGVLLCVMMVGVVVVRSKLYHLCNFII